MKKRKELMQSIKEMEAAIEADASSNKFLAEPLETARKELAELDTGDPVEVVEPKTTTAKTKTIEKPVAKKSPTKKEASKPKATTKKAPPKRKTSSKPTPIDYDWKKTYKSEVFQPMHFKADFSIMKLEKDSKIRLYPCTTSTIVKKGHYLVLNPQGRPFTVISPSMVDKLTATGIMSEKMVTKATSEKWKAKAAELEEKLKKAKEKPKAEAAKSKPSPKTIKSKDAKSKSATPKKTSPKPTSSTTGSKPKRTASCQVTNFTGDLPQPLYRYLLEQATLYQEAAKENKFKANERIFKILKVYQRNDKAGELVAQLQIETPFKTRILGFGGSKNKIGYYNLCVNRGISTTKRPSNFSPRKKEWTLIADKRLMKNMYSPGQGTTVNMCRDLAAKAFSSDGGIENKTAWESHRSKCTNQGAVKIGQEYVKWLHDQTKKNRKEGDEYYEAMQRVVDDIRAKRS